MRILCWCDAFWPRVGGVEVLAARVVLGLRARGHQVLVVSDRQVVLEAESSFQGIPVRRFPFLETAHFRDADRWVALRQEVAALKRRFQPDVTWIYHPNIDAAFHLATLAACGSPTLVTAHGAYADGLTAEEHTIGRVLRTADWVTACTAAALDDTRTRVPEIVGRSSVVWTGLEMPPQAPRPLPAGPPRLLCAGRMRTVREKGFDVAIHALPAVLDRFPGARLAIAGDGPARPEIEAIARDAGVRDHVDFLGWVRPDDLPDVMSDATLVLVPSRVAAGFGLAALQAAQMARVVVAANVGGLREVVADGETGVLCEPGSAEALAAATLDLLADRDGLARMGVRARQRAALGFSLERHVDQYDELLRRLAWSVVPAGME